MRVTMVGVFSRSGHKRGYRLLTIGTTGHIADCTKHIGKLAKYPITVQGTWNTETGSTLEDVRELQSILGTGYSVTAI